MLAIESLKSAISARNGLARNNLWRVDLPLSIVAGGDIFAENNKQHLNVMCSAAQLPGRQITTNERTIGVKTEKMPYGFLKDDVSLTFYDNNDYSIRRYFETWQNRVLNQNTYEIKYKNEYSADVFISQLDHNNRFVYGVTLLEAFPTTLNLIELNNEQNGLVEINVQLSYSNWK